MYLDIYLDWIDFIRIINKLHTMCKGWISYPVRNTQYKIESNCSPLTIYNVVSTALFVHCTTHICTPGWHGGRFSLRRYDGENHVLRSVSLCVSDRILLASIPC